MTEVGNFEFESGAFDNWEYEKHWEEDDDCRQCDCYCTETVDSVVRKSSVKRELHLTLTSTNCPVIDGTFLMTQVFVQLYDTLLYPTVVSWPQKYQWISEPIPCPYYPEDYSICFVLTCVLTRTKAKPQFNLAVVRFGGGAYSKSTLSFDPSSPFTLSNSGTDDTIAPSGLASCTDDSTCVPFVLEFPFIIETDFEGSVEACCGGVVVSGDPGTTSDPSYLYVVITE